MGVFGDYFGGQAKVRELPSEMRNLANQGYDMAGTMHDYFNRIGANADAYAPQIQNQIKQARSALIPALNFSQQRADESRGLWNSSFYPAIQTTLSEMTNAGSASRQQAEANTARDNYMNSVNAALQQMQRGAARTGFTGAKSPYNAQTAISMAGGAANASNAARLNERRYGENVRMNNLGNFMAQGDAAQRHSALPSSFQQQLASLMGNEAGVLANLLGQTVPFSTQSSKLGQTAYTQFGNNHNYDLMRDQANAQRRNNMIEGGLNMISGLVPMGTMLRGGNNTGTPLQYLQDSGGGSGGGGKLDQLLMMMAGGG